MTTLSKVQVIPTVKSQRIERLLASHSGGALEWEWRDLAIGEFPSNVWADNHGRLVSNKEWQSLVSEYARKATLTAAVGPVVCMRRNEYWFIDGQTTTAAHRSHGVLTIGGYFITTHLSESRSMLLRRTFNIETSNDTRKGELRTAAIRDSVSGGSLKTEYSPAVLAKYLGMTTQDVKVRQEDEMWRQWIEFYAGPLKSNTQDVRVWLKKGGMILNHFQEASEPIVTFLKILDQHSDNNGQRKPLCDIFTKHTDRPNPEKWYASQLQEVQEHPAVIASVAGKKTKHPNTQVQIAIHAIDGALTTVKDLISSKEYCDEKSHSRVKGVIHEIGSRWAKVPTKKIL